MAALTQSDRMVSSHLPRRALRVPFLTAWISQAMRTTLLWQQRRRTRTHLSQLPSYLLHDVGLTEDDVRIERNKPFWRP